jgi:hypothetical protein
MGGGAGGSSGALEGGGGGGGRRGRGLGLEAAGFGDRQDGGSQGRQAVRAEGEAAIEHHLPSPRQGQVKITTVFDHLQLQATLRNQGRRSQLFDQEGRQLGGEG